MLFYMFLAFICVSFICSFVFSVCVCCCTFTLVVLPYWRIKEYIITATHLMVAR